MFVKLLGFRDLIDIISSFQPMWHVNIEALLHGLHWSYIFQ